jgi:hypothetical protein
MHFTTHDHDLDERHSFFLLPAQAALGWYFVHNTFPDVMAALIEIHGDQYSATAVARSWVMLMWYLNPQAPTRWGYTLPMSSAKNWIITIFDFADIWCVCVWTNQHPLTSYLRIPSGSQLVLTYRQIMNIIFFLRNRHLFNIAMENCP